MARREKSSGLENAIKLASKLPWWACFILAPIAYFALQAVATRPLAAHVNGRNPWDGLNHTMACSTVTVLCMLGQYVLPVIFLIGAIVSAIESSKRKRLYGFAKSQSDAASLNQMSWEEFETLVGEHFRKNGFNVSRRGGNGPDGGIDLVLRQGQEKHLVQCKQWKAYKVGVQPVREFYGVMAASGAAGGYFVTSGVYTDEAKAFVKGLNLELIDGRSLKAMIEGASMVAPIAKGNPAIVADVPASASPSCPKCGAEMKVRVARQGSNAGKDFWGCSTFPKCNGTRLIDDAAGRTSAPAPLAPVEPPTQRICPHCGGNLVLKKFQSGPKEGEEFYACLPCKKGYPARSGLQAS